MNEIKLKPCPFCGGNGVVRTSMDGYDEFKVFSVSCTNKGCVAYLTRDYWERDINGLVKKWNSRYEPPIIVDYVKQGNWVQSVDDDGCAIKICSECGGKMPYVVPSTLSEDDWIEAANYCWKCGAKMEGEISGE